MTHFIWNYVKKHPRRYLVMVVAMLVYDVTLVLPTRLVQTLIDSINQGSLTWDSLWQLVASLFGMAFLSYGLAYVWHTNLRRGAIDFKFIIQDLSFKKLLQMRRPFYDKFRSGDMLTRFSSDTESLEDLLNYGLLVALYAGGMVAFILPVMLWLSWQTTLVALVPLLVLMLAFQVIGKRQEVLVEDKREAVASLSNEVLEVIEGIRVSRAFQQKAVQADLFRDKADTLAKRSNQVMAYQYSYTPLTLTLVGLSTVAVLWFGAQGIEAGHLTLGQVIALQLYMMSLIEPFMMLADLVLVYQTGKTSFLKIHELLEASDDLEADGSMVLEHLEEIRFDNYSFSYPQSARPSLIDIKLTLKAGQTLGIVGKTGSGKTSLVRQLLRQYPLGQGKLTINGRPIADYQRRSVTSHLAYVPQEHVLFSKSVEANIQVGRANASQEDILSAIDMASFSSDLAKMSSGLDTLVGERGVSISGGQKQRLSLARAFLREADLLILDDALSAVDAKTEQAIIEQLQTKRQGKTNIIVTHRLSAVQHADYIIVLDEGRISQAGSPSDLLAQEGWYAEQYRRQALQEVRKEGDHVGF